MDIEYATGRLREIGATCRMQISATDRGLKVDDQKSGREYAINQHPSGKTFRVYVDGEAVSGYIRSLDNAIDKLRIEVAQRNYTDMVDIVLANIYTS